MKTHTMEDTATKAGILKLCQISDITYNQMVLDSGNAYAKKHCQNEGMFSALTHSKIYWLWYTNQFMLIDKALVECPVIPDHSDYLVLKGWEGIAKISHYEYWLRMHDHRRIIAYPGKQIWDDVEARLMGQVIDEEMKGQGND